MSETPAAKPTKAVKRSAPWKGRRKVADPKSKPFPIRFTPAQFTTLTERARDRGLAVGAFARAVLLGESGPRAVRRPPVEKEALARILGELGKVGSNVNQIAKAFNERREVPAMREIEEMRSDLAAMRTAIMTALGREP